MEYANIVLAKYNALGKWSLGGEPHHPVAPFMRRELKTKDEK
jgi:hypothetical protein